MHPAQSILGSLDSALEFIRENHAAILAHDYEPAPLEADLTAIRDRVRQKTGAQEDLKTALKNTTREARQARQDGYHLLSNAITLIGGLLGNTSTSAKQFRAIRVKLNRTKHKKKPPGPGKTRPARSKKSPAP